MRVMKIHQGGADALSGLPENLPGVGTLWISCLRSEFDEELAEIQTFLQSSFGFRIVDLHVSDLRNAQLGSRYDYTSYYEVVVFRRLLTEHDGDIAVAPEVSVSRSPGPPLLRRLGTAPVAFVVIGSVLLTVHPPDGHLRDTFISRLSNLGGSAGRDGSARLPTGPADLMLRMTSAIVDGFLDQRQPLSRQLERWQSELLTPGGRFRNWRALLDARVALRGVGDVALDQRTAMSDWMGALETSAVPESASDRRDLDLLKVRGRDVLEHIDRVVRHVERLERDAETAVQIHFSAQGHRTNEIMRTLTVLTAVFMPLNLITGFFGMNFPTLPLIERQGGIWWATALMGITAAGLLAVFWRRRYLSRSAR